MTVRKTTLATALLAAGSTVGSTVGFAHPGPHEHMALSEAIAHAMGPFHLGLVAVAVVAAGALAIVTVSRRRAAVARRTEEDRRS